MIINEMICESQQKFIIDNKLTKQVFKFPNFTSFDLKDNFMEVPIMDN